MARIGGTAFYRRMLSAAAQQAQPTYSRLRGKEQSWASEIGQAPSLFTKPSLVEWPAAALFGTLHTVPNSTAFLRRRRRN
jgi:hypothetical protein